MLPAERRALPLRLDKQPLRNGRVWLKHLPCCVEAQLSDDDNITSTSSHSIRRGGGKSRNGENVHMLARRVTGSAAFGPLKPTGGRRWGPDSQPETRSQSWCTVDVSSFSIVFWNKMKHFQKGSAKFPQGGLGVSRRSSVICSVRGSGACAPARRPLYRFDSGTARQKRTGRAGRWRPAKRA